MENGERSYQSYLLRLWKDPLEEDWDWRASLEDPVSGELEGFKDLASLFESLRERTMEQKQDRE